MTTLPYYEIKYICTVSWWTLTSSPACTISFRRLAPFQKDVLIIFFSTPYFDCHFKRITCFTTQTHIFLFYAPFLALQKYLNICFSSILTPVPSTAFWSKLYKSLIFSILKSGTSLAVPTFSSDRQTKTVPSLHYFQKRKKVLSQKAHICVLSPLLFYTLWHYFLTNLLNSLAPF